MRCGRGGCSVPIGRMTKDVRALELYRLARSVVEKGRFVSVGILTYQEYKLGELSIRHWPSTGHLEVWHKRKVLSVNREHGQLMVRHYVPGEWEKVIQDAAGKGDGCAPELSMGQPFPTSIIGVQRT
jgi:hypothetical protein